MSWEAANGFHGNAGDSSSYGQFRRELSSGKSDFFHEKYALILPRETVQLFNATYGRGDWILGRRAWVPDVCFAMGSAAIIGDRALSWRAGWFGGSCCLVVAVI